MEGHGAMGEVGDEIELDLGLSIGGTFRKAEKPKPAQKEAGFGSSPLGFDAADAKENHRSTPSPPAFARELDQEPALLDPQKKREIQAFRRQEAKKKREEKQQRKGTCKPRNGECVNGGFSVSDDDKMWPGVQDFQTQTRLRDRQSAKENDGYVEEPACKRGKIQQLAGSERKERRNDINLNIGNEQATANPATSAFASPPCFVPPLEPQPPCSQLQSPSLLNGFAFPYLMPCWAPGAPTSRNDKTVFQARACRSFRPYQREPNSASGIDDSEQYSGKDSGNRKSGSSGSPVRSSSAVSDYQSTSQHGGGGSDSGSYSSQSLLEQPQMNGSIASHAKGMPEQNTRCDQTEYAQSMERAAYHMKGTVTSSAAQFGLIKPEESRVEELSDPSKGTNPATDPPAGTRGENGKPPKPQTQRFNAPSLAQMPYVSTTGNGPNGKTVTGLLYRYTKTEVSIICVCHGSSFSPSEFVEHAGGIDVTHPLKHITVISSAFS